MNFRKWTLAAVTGVVAVTATLVLTTARAQYERIQFPEDYTNFTNILSLDRLANDGQIMRIFANDIAIQGLDRRGRLADGAIVVGEIYAAATDEEGNVILSELGRRIRGDLAAIAVMEKQDGWGDIFSEELRNHDWDFALFGPDGTRRDTDLDSCRACHAPLDDRDHVFAFEHLPMPGM